MYANTIQSKDMKHKKVSGKPMAFKQAIKSMLDMPYMTHKQIDELRKQGKLNELTKKK